MKLHRNKISVPATVLLIVLILLLILPFYVLLVGGFKPNTS